MYPDTRYTYLSGASEKGHAGLRGEMQMKEIAFSYKKSALVSPHELRGITGKLQRETRNMKKAALMHYTDDRASINLPDDEKMVKKVKDTVEKKCALYPAFLIVYYLNLLMIHNPF